MWALFAELFLLFFFFPPVLRELAEPEDSDSQGPKEKRRRIEESSNKKEEEEEEEGESEGEEEAPALSTFEEVKEAFAEFVDRVPSEMIPRLHKLIRERERTQDGDSEGPGGDDDQTPTTPGTLKGDHLIASIVTRLRERLPVSAHAPEEELVFNRGVGFEEMSKETTTHVDSFLFDDDDVDDLCDQGLLQRNFCADCHSKNVKPLSKCFFHFEARPRLQVRKLVLVDFISHSLSVMECHFLFEECLGDKVKGKLFVDVGSRTGASLYMVSTLPTSTGVHFDS